MIIIIIIITSLLVSRFMSLKFSVSVGLPFLTNLTYSTVSRYTLLSQEMIFTSLLRFRVKDVYSINNEMSNFSSVESRIKWYILLKLLVTGYIRIPLTVVSVFLSVSVLDSFTLSYQHHQMIQKPNSSKYIERERDSRVRVCEHDSTLLWFSTKQQGITLENVSESRAKNQILALIIFMKTRGISRGIGVNGGKNDDSRSSSKSKSVVSLFGHSYHHRHHHPLTLIPSFLIVMVIIFKSGKTVPRLNRQSFALEEGDTSFI
jgi:hypothetical protein